MFSVLVVLKVFTGFNMCKKFAYYVLCTKLNICIINKIIVLYCMTLLSIIELS